KTRLAGQAVNATTPTGTLGGDAVKVWLLRDRVGVREGLSSIIIGKTSLTISQGLFLLLGILAASWALPDDLPLVRAMEWLLVLETIGVGGFVAVQLAGVLGGGSRLLERFGVRTPVGLSPAAAKLDETLSTFYLRQPRRLLLSVLFNLLGWVASAAETW